MTELTMKTRRPAANDDLAVMRRIIKKAEGLDQTNLDYLIARLREITDRRAGSATD